MDDFERGAALCHTLPFSPRVAKESITRTTRYCGRRFTPTKPSQRSAARDAARSRDRESDQNSKCACSTSRNSNSLRPANTSSAKLGLARRLRQGGANECSKLSQNTALTRIRASPRFCHTFTRCLQLDE